MTYTHLKAYDDLTLDWTKRETVENVFESFKDLESLVLTIDKEEDNYVIKLES